jgi:class 3 adenylate cyclase
MAEVTPRDLPTLATIHRHREHSRLVALARFLRRGACGAGCARSALADVARMFDHPRVTEERRIVTVMFADVVDSTALVERMDAEDARALLGRYYGVARDVVEEHGGTVEKFIGDAVVAVFGLPRAHGDDADRALAAALELRERVAGDVELLRHLSVRVGVNTGEVVANPGASGDFLITGDAVNVAARLQQASDPRAILCGERTVRAAGPDFRFGPPLAVEARGKTFAIPARALLGVEPPAAPARPRLVGRDADLEQLQLVARRVQTDQRPYLVTIVAPPGTGKTRLLEEFLDRLPTIAPDTRVAVGTCLPYGQRLTYWPLRGVLNGLIDGLETASPADSAACAREWLGGCGVEDPARIADLLLATVGLAGAEGVERGEIFAAWRTLVEAAARLHPVVLVLEDLHWSSDSLLELVEAVLQPRGNLPVMAIALSRPELIDRRPAWGGGQMDYLALALRPLPDDAMAILVRDLLGDAAHELVGGIVARAEGNPFFAGEIVRSVRDRGQVEHDGRTGQTASTLPDTVHATVLARLDLLPPASRRLMQLGAVFGREFPIGGAAALAGEPLDEVRERAEGLVARDLLLPMADSYLFRHILIRDVAYGTLPRTQRAELHEQAAGWLEQTLPEGGAALAELIAFHYREAAVLGARTATEAGPAAIRTRATTWLLRAADSALMAAASGEAAAHLSSALELAAPDQLPLVHERMGDVQLDGEKSMRSYREALRLLRELDAPADDQLRVLGRLLTVLTRTQGSVATRPSVDEMRQLRAEGEALAARATDQRSLATFLVGRAFLPFWNAVFASPDELDRAEAAAQQALEIARRLDDADMMSAALDALSTIAQVRGRWDQARAYAERRVEFQGRLTVIERLDAYAMVTWSAALMGDLVGADRVSSEGLALVQPRQTPAFTLHLLAWRIYALSVLGRWDEATTAGRRAVELWHEAHRPPAWFALRGFLAAFDVATARADRDRSAELASVIRDAIAAFPGQDPIDRTRAYLDRDVPTLIRMVNATFEHDAQDVEQLLAAIGAGFGRPEYWERALSVIADRGAAPSDDALGVMRRIAAARGHPILEAGVLRTVGVAHADPASLRSALALFKLAGALPLVARCRCEIGRMTGDDGELSAGLAVLDSLGDRESLARYA